MRKTHRSLSSSLEPLESRIAPASISAMNVGGVLKISALTASTAASFSLTQTGASEFDVRDDTVPGTPAVHFTNVNSILMTLSDQSDWARFTTATSSPFKGAVTVNTLAGVNDRVEFQGATVVIGAVTVNSVGTCDTLVASGVKFYGPLKVTSPGGGLGMSGTAETVTTFKLDIVQLAAGADIKKALTINTIDTPTSANALFLMQPGSTVRSVLTYVGGNVNDQLTLEGQVLGKTAIKLGGGGNSVIAMASYQTASFSVVGGPFADNVNLSGDNTLETQFGGNVSIALGDGQNTVTTTNVRVGGAFKVTGGTGNDNVTINGGVIGGVIQPSLGDGNNSVTLSNVFFAGGGLKVTTGNGNDSVNVGQSNILGPARFALGSGANGFGFNSGGSFFDSGFAYVGLGGNDAVQLGGMTVRGAVSISTGEGDTNSIRLFGTKVYGATQFKGGNGASDYFEINNQSNLNGTLTINAGNGGNGANIAGLGNVTTFAYNGGSGTDGITIGGGGLFTRITVKLGLGSDAVTNNLNGFLTFKIDGGADGGFLSGFTSPDLVLVNMVTV